MARANATMVIAQGPISGRACDVTGMRKRRGMEKIV
jgi:hypothetical protein